MDTKQIEYILKIAEENNITKAAEKLFITQSALNQQLLKLEKELGTSLFHRSRTNWRPTEAGEVYIKNAKKILSLKKETYNQISDIGASHRGKLSVGFTPGRGIHMFTAVYPEFHQHYPEINVEPVEKSVHELQNMIAEDSLDIAFLTLQEQDKTNDEYIHILTEEIVLAIPASHPLAEQAAPAGAPLSIMDLKNLQHEPFVLMDKNSTMRALTNSLFHQAQISPNILFETKSNTTITSMIQMNLCCGLIPYYYVKESLPGIALFALKGHPNWQVVSSYRRGSYLSAVEKAFIQMAKAFWIKNL